MSRRGLVALLTGCLPMTALGGQDKFEIESSGRMVNPSVEFHNGDKTVFRVAWDLSKSLLTVTLDDESISLTADEIMKELKRA